jgi:hypothetical protein
MAHYKLLVEWSVRTLSNSSESARANRITFFSNLIALRSKPSRRPNPAQTMKQSHRRKPRRTHEGSMRISGIITAWFPRGYGYITARQGTRASRFYLHISRVVGLDESLEEPIVGCRVTFEPTNDLKRSPRDIPSAIEAEVGPPPHRDPIVDNLLQALSGNGGAQ